MELVQTSTELSHWEAVYLTYSFNKAMAYEVKITYHGNFWRSFINRFLKTHIKLTKNPI